MSRMTLFGLAIIIFALAAFVFWQVFAYNVPEPEYQVVQAAADGMEVREYPPLIVAEVTVKGERYKAINQGFRMLAGYIFGDNQKQEKIAMTAPVIQQGVKIDMTAPILQQQAGDGWLVRFVMPKEYSLKTLPKPNNPKVKLLQMPTRRYAVITFSGRNTDENIQGHLKRLLEYTQLQKLQVVGTPVLAFYNPPWILPFLRRNEIFLRIR